MSSNHEHSSRSRSPLSRHRQLGTSGTFKEKNSHYSQAGHHESKNWCDSTKKEWGKTWNYSDCNSSHWSSPWDSQTWATSFDDGSPYPSSWKPDAGHLDSTEAHGLALGHRVAKTAWSSDEGLSGLQVERITLADVAFTGHKNWYFRHLSAGRFTSVEFTRSVKESLLVQAVLKAARMKDSNGQQTDIDKLTQSFSPVSSPSKPADMYNAAAVKLFEYMKESTPLQQATEHLDKVRALEAEIQKYKNANAQQREVTTPTKGRTSAHGKASGVRGHMSPKPGDDLPILAETDEHEGQEDPDVNPNHGVYARGKRRRVLKDKHPSVTTTATFNKWLKENLNAKQQTAFGKAHKAIQEHYNSKEKELKAELPDLASDWGLPVKLSANADTQWLLKILTVAVLLSQ